MEFTYNGEPINFLEARAYDSDGKEIEVPKCKNGHYKTQVTGKNAFTWVCLECEEE